MFQYKDKTPRLFIKNLKKKWVKIDTMVIKRLQNKYPCVWDVDKEHVMSFRVCLNQEQKTYSESTPAVVITEEEKQRHYLEEVLKHPERWGEKCMTEWDGKNKAGEAYTAPPTHFKP